MALLSPPVLMLLWEGNIDGLVLLGFVGLPWGVPLLLIKPFVAGWAVLARREWLLWSAGFGILTLLIWGLWPIEMMEIDKTHYLQQIAMGWHNLGWPMALVGVILMLRSNAAPIRLMAAGSFLTPYLMPYHLLVLLPSLGHVQSWKRWLLWGWAWTLILVPAFAGYSRYLAMGFPLAVWWLLRDGDGN